MSPILLYIAVGGILAALALARLTSRRRDSASSPDLLAEAENEDDPYTARYVAPKTPQEPEPPKTDLPDPLIWQEQEDVYRPVPVDGLSFVRSLPLKQVPEIKEAGATIFIRRHTYAQILAHLKSNLEVELGGLLVGQALLDTQHDAYLLLIEEALPADEGVETATSFEYTAATWQHITPYLQRMNAAWTVMGSYHSHPGLGVFLSTTDHDTQKEIFSQDWQVALVVDPVAEEFGFFVGEDGKACPDWHLLEREEGRGKREE
jgi:proteasome lid subunit RPN8/RPN11